MAQLTIYLSDEIVARLKLKLSAQGETNISAFVRTILEREVVPQRWPDGFSALYGSCGGSLPEPEDVALEERELFK